ncbi:type II toxin-antitoxin system RelE/ParE family toxin [Prosthecobacter sp.]
MNFVFNQAALIEYREAAEWYQSRSLLAGPRFIQEVETAIQAILKDPQRYQAIGNGCQVFRLKRFPYKLYYLHEPELITIYAVMHDRRKPDIWRDRLG